MSQRLLAWTPPAKFPWSSVDRSLNFFERLSRISLDSDTSGLANIEETRRDSARLADVLQLLEEFTPVKLATLWKLKENANLCSAIVRTRAYDTILEPSNPDHRTEFVCPIRETHIELILQRYRKKRSFNPESNGIVYFNDIGVLPTDVFFNTSQRINQLELKKQICLPFLVERSPSVDRDKPNYLLNMYLSDYPDGVEAFIPLAILRSVVSRLASGINALIDRRLLRITREVSNFTVAETSGGSDFAMRNTIMRVLPRFIMCERLIYLVPLDAQKFQVRLHKGFRHTGDGLSSTDLPALDPSTLSALVTLAQRELAREDVSVQAADTAICLQSSVERNDRFSDLPTEFSIMIGKIHNRTDPDRPRGYIFLFSKINELALMKDSSTIIPDAFDWVDSTYLSHICSILDFIAELFTVEESRLQRVHVLAHEMHAPTGFIYSTAERLKNNLSGSKQMSDAMKKAELADILATNDLQTALIDSLVMGMQTGALPPKSRYNPQRVRLRDIADNVARISYPICRRYRVPQKNIKMRQFPDLFIDRRAITQIFLNMLTNAIKYSKSDRPEDFSVNVFSEEIALAELSATNAPLNLVERLENLRVRTGYLFTFEDQGIGIPEFFASKIFRPGARADIAAVQERTGAGLGLSVVRSIMRDHFGEVWVEGFRDPTTFHLFFPDILRDDSYCTLADWRGVVR